MAQAQWVGPSCFERHGLPLLADQLVLVEKLCPVLPQGAANGGAVHSAVRSRCRQLRHAKRMRALHEKQI